MYAESSKDTTRTSTNETRCSSPALPRCANCDIEFPWSSIVVRGISYCCTGCAAGGPCSCDYSQYRSVNIAGVIHYDMHENDVSIAPSQSHETREQQ
ncbi:MAG TPA: hypothetical protein VGN34_10405 [Ktedonobacteraceae bacterium]